MSAPKSFSFFGREGRKYRCYFNPQRGHWYAAFHDGTRRQRVALHAKTKADAEIAVKALDMPPPPKPEAEPVQWAEFRALYLEYKTEQGKAPRSVERFKAALDAFGRYLAAKGLKRVDEITLPILEGYIPYRTKTEKRGAKTAYTDVLCIKNATKWGSKASRGLLKVNPALEWETKEPVQPKRKTYTAEEVAKLEAGARTWMKPIITTLAWTGMRIGELVNLRWKDVDLEKRLVYIRIREDWKPKGRADRTVPMHPKVEAAIRQQRVGEFVFCSMRGGRVNESRALQDLKKDQRRLELPDGDLHGFRRFFATTMMQAGVSTETVRQWGGWQSLETMLRYLADVDVKNSLEAMDAAAKKLAATA